MQVYVKHSMSCLLDQAMTLEIDHERQMVHLSVSVFDSALLGRFVVETLPERFGVVAHEDDLQKDMRWLTERAPYGLRVGFDEREFNARVVRLVDGTIAVTLHADGAR